jgi:predicted Zn-dependent protease
MCICVTYTVNDAQQERRREYFQGRQAEPNCLLCVLKASGIEFNSAVNLQNTNRADEALKKFETLLKKHPNSGVKDRALHSEYFVLGCRRIW